MELIDHKNIVKKIGAAWKQTKEMTEYGTISNETRNIYLEKMLTYRYALEMCGLTLNEIISLGNADDLNIAVDELFSKSQTK